MKLFTSLLGLCLACSAKAATTTTTSCPSASTTVAKFDNLPTGAAVPSGYSGLNWSGYTVKSGASVGVAPHSSPNIIIGDVFGTHLDDNSKIGNGFAYNLESFSFACVALSGNSYVPVTCDLQIFSREGGTEPSQVYGPYNTTQTPAHDGLIPLANVTLSGAVSGLQVWFMATNCPGFSQLILDNVKIVQTPTC